MVRGAFGLLLFVAGGCGGAEAAPAGPDDGPAGGERRRGGSSMAVESEIGALDEGQVQATFQRLSGKLGACYAKGAQRVPYLAGSVSFKVRVQSDGRARWVYLKDSDLGDATTESCMLEVLRNATWPQPDSGDGLANNDNVSFEPGGDERPPVEWKPEQLGEPFEKLRPDLSRCRRDAGTGPVKVTLYVETDGKPKAVGASTADEKGEAAARCIVEALQGAQFPSPGSYASKVTVVVD
jgi:hypothetical protein